MLIYLIQKLKLTIRSKHISQTNRLKIEALLRDHSPIKLELGAGRNRGLKGWTYADINNSCDLVLDFLKPLPFPESSVQMIYSSHLLEHFNYSELFNFLMECHRILVPNGIFSAAVPNARIYLDAYHNPANFNVDVFCRHKPAYHGNSKIDYVNYIAYMAGHHRYMFDDENIVNILTNSGFTNARTRDFDEHLDVKERKIQSIYVEAEKQFSISPY